MIPSPLRCTPSVKVEASAVDCEKALNLFFVCQMFYNSYALGVKYISQVVNGCTFICVKLILLGMHY